MQIGRSVQIITSEATEWPRYMAEENERASLIQYGILMIVAANIAQAIGSMFFSAGFAYLGLSAPYFLTMHVVRLALEIAALFMIPKIIASIAPSFAGEKNELSALKLYVYAMTPAWLGMVLTFIPILGWIAALAGGIYAIVLFIKHTGEAMAVPEEKKVGFVAVVALSIFVAYVVFGFIATAIAGMLFVGSVLTTGYHEGWRM